MTNLFYLAEGGLLTGQTGLDVIGNNLTNAFTPGFNRRDMILNEVGGGGVDVGGINRAYDQFVNNELRDANSNYQDVNTRYQQLQQIDDQFSNDDDNLSDTLNDLFKEMEHISKHPNNGSAREDVFSKLKQLVQEFHDNSGKLDELEKDTNNRIGQSVDKINSLTKQLADLNQKILKSAGKDGKPPANLLDQRDQLLSQLSSQTGVKVHENSDGTVNVSIGNGVDLVNGDQAYKLKAVPDPDNPKNQAIAYIDSSGNQVMIDQSKLQGGTLSGLFKFRDNNLVDYRNKLNQIALQLAGAFNKVNEQGYDKNGDKGQAIFNFSPQDPTGNINNQGNAKLKINFDNLGDVKSQNYKITFKNGQWHVTTADGTAVPAKVDPKTGNLEFDGLSISITGTPKEGDSFQFNPTDGIADSLKMNIHNGNKIAASNKKNGKGNNKNIKKMMNLKHKKLVNGETLNDAYTDLVGDVGNDTDDAQGQVQNQQKVMQNYQQQQQDTSGVNLNEEFANLQMYQQYYQANAQLLKTANSLFETILSVA